MMEQDNGEAADDDDGGEENDDKYARQEQEKIQGKIKWLLYGCTVDEVQMM